MAARWVRDRVEKTSDKEGSRAGRLSPGKAITFVHALCLRHNPRSFEDDADGELQIPKTCPTDKPRVRPLLGDLFYQRRSTGLS